MKSLVIGLGNKGSNYKTQRHNVGSEIVSKICRIKDITLIERAKYKARIGLDSNQVSYLIPNTYEFKRTIGGPVSQKQEN